MELRSNRWLEHLKSNKRKDVVVFSDSKYVVDSVEKKWVFQWGKKRFKEKECRFMEKILIDFTNIMFFPMG